MADDRARSDDLGQEMIVTITLGPDGKAYFHDLTFDLLPVAAALAGDAPEMTARLSAAEHLKEKRT